MTTLEHHGQHGTGFADPVGALGPADSRRPLLFHELRVQACTGITRHGRFLGDLRSTRERKRAGGEQSEYTHHAMLDEHDTARLHGAPYANAHAHAQTGSRGGDTWTSRRGDGCCAHLRKGTELSP